MLWQRTYGFPSSIFWGTVSVLLALLVRWWHQKRKSISNVPRKWRCVGDLSELTVFPIKSCAGISLQEAECTEYGIQTVCDGPLKLRDRFVPKSQIKNYVNHFEAVVRGAEKHGIKWNNSRNYEKLMQGRATEQN
jgi:hypothetical protein